MNSSILTYRTPAASWVECLPLGDGTLGAMLDGGVPIGRIELNHEGAWSGGPGSEARTALIGPEQARDALSQARARLAEGRPDLAARALAPHQARYGQSFLPLGTLVLSRGSATPDGAYRRSLDLATAVHTLETSELRERAMVSAPYGVFVMQSSDAVAVDLESPHRLIARSEADEALEIIVRLPSDVPPPHEGDRYPAATWDDAPDAAMEAIVRVVTVESSGGTVLFLTAATMYDGPGRPLRTLDEARTEVRRRTSAAQQAGVDAVFSEGVDSHAQIFERARLDTGAAPQHGESTDARLQSAFAQEEHPLAEDPGLAGLLFDVGRYLAISSTRAGSALPATLQGIWNGAVRPPWSSNFTLNINAEMNLWSAHVTNMSETAEPWARFVEALADAGTAAARRLYDMPGWVAHHNSDAWLFTSSVGEGQGDARWAHWPMAAPWLVRSVWDAVEFGADVSVAQRLWPTARAAAEFALSWQRSDGAGGWITAPATSPENVYALADGTEAALDTTVAMDEQLIEDLYTIVGRLARLVGQGDDPIARAARERLAAMAPTPRVSADGLILEWATERPEVEVHHRHVSHLYGLYPGAGLWDAPSRAAAAASLERRGDESTGWSLVWKMALWARLGRGDKVGDLLALLFREAGEHRGPEAGGLYPNMFAAHPPFQIDANLGFPGVLAECLVQSHDGIALLPALPPQLASGTARGLVARPGVEVDIEWESGALVRASLRPRTAETVDIRLGERRIIRDLRGPIVVTPADFE